MPYDEQTEPDHIAKIEPPTDAQTAAARADLRWAARRAAIAAEDAAEDAAREQRLNDKIAAGRADRAAHKARQAEGDRMMAELRAMDQGRLLSGGGVPFMITEAQQQGLRQRGYTPEQIHMMTPEVVDEALQEPAPTNAKAEPAQPKPSPEPIDEAEAANRAEQRREHLAEQRGRSTAHQNRHDRTPISHQQAPAAVAWSLANHGNAKPERLRTDAERRRLPKDEGFLLNQKDRLRKPGHRPTPDEMTRIDATVTRIADGIGMSRQDAEAAIRQLMRKQKAEAHERAPELAETVERLDADVPKFDDADDAGQMPPLIRHRKFENRRDDAGGATPGQEPGNHEEPKPAKPQHDMVRKWHLLFRDLAKVSIDAAVLWLAYNEHHIEKSGYAEHTYKEWATTLGVSVSTVRRKHDRLAKLGLIDRDRDSRGGGRGVAPRIMVTALLGDKAEIELPLMPRHRQPKAQWKRNREAASKLEGDPSYVVTRVSPDPQAHPDDNRDDNLQANHTDDTSQKKVLNMVSTFCGKPAHHVEQVSDAKPAHHGEQVSAPSTIKEEEITDQRQSGADAPEGPLRFSLRDSEFEAEGRCAPLSEAAAMPTAAETAEAWPAPTAADPVAGGADPALVVDPAASTDPADGGAPAAPPWYETEWYKFCYERLWYEDEDDLDLDPVYNAATIGAEFGMDRVSCSCSVERFYNYMTENDRSYHSPAHALASLRGWFRREFHKEFRKG